MKNKKIFVLLTIYILFVGLIGCTGIVENPWESEIADNLTDKEWVREYNVSLSDREVTTREIRIFKKDASGSYEIINTFDDGEVTGGINYFKWTFITAHFHVIYMDSDTYWEIEKLTSEILYINESNNDPIEYPEEARKYKEYKANK